MLIVDNVDFLLSTFLSSICLDGLINLCSSLRQTCVVVPFGGAPGAAAASCMVEITKRGTQC